jgi:hypothetical protein
MKTSSCVATNEHPKNWKTTALLTKEIETSWVAC